MKRNLTPVLFLLLCSLIILFYIKPISAQNDPFHINETGPITVKSQDIYLLWMEDIGGGNLKSYQKVYRYKTNGILIPIDSLDIDTMFTKTSRREDSRPGSSSYVDVANGNFNIDPYDDAVSVWRNNTSTQKIEIMISHFDTTGFFTNSTATTFDAGEGIRQDEEIYSRTGNFDSDSTDEFILAYRDASDSVIFCMYDVDSTLQTTLVNRFSNTKVAGSGLTHFVKYYVETADLNDDGIDELISYTWESGVTTSVPITVRIYAFEGNNIVAKGTTVIQVPTLSQTTLQDFIMASARGQFDSDQSDELVFSAVAKFQSDNLHVSHHYILDVTQNLQTITVGPRAQYTLAGSNNHNTNPLTEFSLATGDLNNTFNKRDEVVFAAGNRVRVAAIADNYSFQTKALINVQNGGTNDYLQSNNYLKVADMNMDNQEDIIIVKNLIGGPNQGFLTAVVTFTDSTLNDGTEKVYARFLGDESQNNNSKRFAITVGNFDGFDYRIGQPEHSVEYGIAQPIVVLNAPPVHFDVLNGNTFDINECYNGGDCDFYSKYIKANNQTLAVTNEVHGDWLISAGLSISGSVTVEPLGVGFSTNYENHLLYNYGEHFSNVSSDDTTFSVTVTVEARDDDRVYTTITDYDVWEYPIYHGNEPFPRNTFLTLIPKSSQGTWFGSKSYFAQNYFPDHEVSNVLSYTDSLTNNPNVFQLLESLPTDRFVIDGTSSNNLHLGWERFTNEGAATIKENGWDIGYQYGAAGRFDGDFSNKEAVTHRTTIQESIDLEVNLGSVNTGIGQVEYAVTPYAYWGVSDALVLDYAVEVPEPPGEDSWWELKYKNYSDPTFILPWRLDPEKGFALSEPAKRMNTKDLLFRPQKPEPGDTLTITARVRNYSLIPTPSSVSVKFYLNDPDSGGIPIIGVTGTNELSTNGPVPSRGRKDVELKWVVPNGLPSYPRIYAVLDQDNSITEIHEDNNKGYAILGSSSVSGVADDNYFIPEEYVLYQSYPNPFNPTTTIKYSIPNSNKVSIKVYDILGREVATLVNEYKNAGTYNIEFNASRFASGVYFYQLQSGSYIATRKMILMK